MEEAMLKDLTERAEHLAGELGPDVIQLVNNVIDEWYENHTTLSGENGAFFKLALKKRTRQKLAQFLTTEAARG